jgi:NTE family protein
MRFGIVLGAGGVLGAAWMTGALCALAEVKGLDPRTADALLGTSAGSVLVAMLAAGIGTETLRDHQRGLPLPEDLRLEWDHDTSVGGPVPLRPRIGLGSPELLRRVVRRELPPRTAIWALLPPGSRSSEPLRRVVDGAVGEGRWAPRDGVTVVAMDYATGARMPFGAPGSAPTSLGEAVAASCAIPGWYAPVAIAGRSYVDGGARSAASVDLLAPPYGDDAPLDRAFVLAPLASFTFDRPTRVLPRLERRWRHYVTTRLMREVAMIEATGTAVTVLCPGAEDLAGMGANMMDPTRRRRVLETSLRTSAAALRAGTAALRAGDRHRAAGL